MGFKVTYRTREKLQKAIQQVIQNENLIIDRTMLKSIRIGSAVGDVGEVTVTINCIYYYVFLDIGTIDIAPFNITGKAIKTGYGKEFLDALLQEYINWVTEKYKILENAKLTIDKLNIQYNVYGGGEYGYPDGIYNPNKQIRV